MAEQIHTEKTPLVSEESQKDELAGCGSTLPCNPRRMFHRYIILIIMCFVGFGTYFCYDNPAALQDDMIRDLDISVSKFMGFYSLYSWPNVIICFFGGFLIDRVFEVRLGAVIFSLFVTVGQGSTKNMNVMQPLYHFISRFEAGYKGLGIALSFGGGICVLSLLCALVLGYLDKRTDRILKRSDVSSDEVISIQDVKKFEISLVYVISAVISPFLGCAIDKVGKCMIWTVLGIVATLGCHVLLAFTFTIPFVAMAVMGVAYSVLAIALWPMVSMIVAHHQLATAYGIMQATQNLGLATISIAAGSIVDTMGYLILEMFFLAWLSISLTAAVILYLIDNAKDWKLNLSTQQRHRQAEEKEEEKKTKKAF